MSKIAILNDSHFGLANNSQRRLKYQLDYHENCVFPILKKQGIKHILHLGDFWHSRKEINPNTFHWVKIRFLDYLKENGIHMDIVPGNHDMYFTQISDVTSLSVLNEYENINIIRKPKLFDIEGCKFSMIPWISNQNDLEELNTFIKDNPHKIMFGHFEMVNFYVTRQMLQTEGLISQEYFKDFEMVVSGHYHLRQIKDNIHYVGTQYEMNWNDFETEKGFSVFNTKTRRLEFHKNDDKLHERIFYNDQEQKKYDEILSALKDKFVRVIIESKQDEAIYQQFLQKLESAGCENYHIVEMAEIKETEDLEFSDEKPLFTFLDEYVKTKLTLKDGDKDNVLKILKKIYLETAEENENDSESSVV